MKFKPAYDELSPIDRQFVDEFTGSIIRESARQFERVTVTLARFEADYVPDARFAAHFDKVLVRAAIRERLEAFALENDLTPARIIREHASIAFGSIERFFPRIGEDGIPVFDATEATTEDWAAVQAIDVVEEFGRGGSKRTIKLRMHAKQPSLEALSKWSGLDQSGNASNERYKSPPKQISTSTPVNEIAEMYTAYLNNGEI